MKDFIFCFFVFAVFILTVNGDFELKNDLVKNTWMNEYNKPTQNDKLRPKREMPRHWCGVRFLKAMSQICNECVKSPPSSIFKRSIADGKVTDMSEFSAHCCKFGCKMDDLKQFCC
uniref:Insulin-like domain-containing protein n=1 Tax=Panagrolaimus sp. PS1159 TaxID=55785 RepID=A0AC35FB81_9BILA